MNVFVATEKTQGQRASDFCFVPNGELVTFGMVCDGNDAIDGGCGCQRSLTGIKCLKGTTTVEVVECGLKVNELALTIKEGSYDGGGWTKLMGEDDAIKCAREDAAELARLAKCFEVGNIIEIRGPTFQARTMPKEA